MTSLNTDKLIVGAWPRRGGSNPRSTVFYDELERLIHQPVYDIKREPWRILCVEIFHFHWPENAYSSVYKALLFTICITIRYWLGKKNIWTVHNIPTLKIKNEFCTYLFRKLCLRIQLFILPTPESKIALSSLGISIKDVKFKVIPLGLYEEPIMRIAPDTGVNLIFGRLTKKKGIIETVDTICSGFPLERVHVAGEPENNEIDEKLRILRDRYPNLTIELGFLDSARVEALLMECRSIVLDYPDDNINSGVATLAATYSVPVFARSKLMIRHLRFLYGVEARSMDVFPQTRRYVPRGYTIKSSAHRFKKILEKMI